MAKNSKSSSITAPRGFKAAGTTCGIKVSGKSDLALIVADVPCSAAGMFTTSKVVGAPVTVSRKHVRSGTARAIICNSGVSNVCTGEQGLADAAAMCGQVADGLGIKQSDVLVASTGVIGPLLPMDKIGRGIATIFSKLGTGPNADLAAARAIMTTDLVPKFALGTVRLGGKTVHLGGIAKGSGMIAPNMATMLAFITTDAAISPPLLKAALRDAVAASFNRMSVDHDTSTSDSVMVLASGKAGHRRISEYNRDYQKFVDALTQLAQDLCYQIIKDGEGATKVFRVAVNQARSTVDADRIGRTVVGSPLVKTAVHGGDPNWGRIMAAVGRSGAAVKPEKTKLTIGDVCVFEQGGPLALSRQSQRRLVSIMRKKDITFTLDMGLGKANATWLGCDLSREYIAINADYTT